MDIKTFETIKTFIRETYRYDDGGEGLPPNPDSLKKKMLRSANHGKVKVRESGLSFHFIDAGFVILLSFMGEKL